MRYEIANDRVGRERAYFLRTTVFVHEQKVPAEMELDEFDQEAVHALALDGDAIVGTGRLVIEGDRGRIGRVAVIKERRGEGIGYGVMALLEAKADELGLSEIYLHSQIHAKDFYSKQGYKPRGEEFDEAGIAHIEMFKKISF